MGMNIAIDGPAGAGKSSVSKSVAGRLQYLYVDTGAMYRTIALALLRSGVDCEDEEALCSALNKMEIGIGYQDGTQQMLLCGEDVTSLIRSEEVSRMASISSAKPVVREKLLQQQRTLAAEHNVVMDGRDIGTRILPDAQLKIFLTASASERARRRYEELKERGTQCTFEQILADIKDRDYRDTHRETAPLMQAADAVCIDSTEMTAEEVTAQIVKLARARFHSDS